MIDKVMCLINAISNVGKVTNISMGSTYASIDFLHLGQKYMVSLMKVEEGADDDAD